MKRTMHWVAIVAISTSASLARAEEKYSGPESLEIYKASVAEVAELCRQSGIKDCETISASAGDKAVKAARACMKQKQDRVGCAEEGKEAGRAFFEIEKNKQIKCEAPPPDANPAPVPVPAPAPTPTPVQVKKHPDDGRIYIRVVNESGVKTVAAKICLLIAKTLGLAKDQCEAVSSTSRRDNTSLQYKPRAVDQAALVRKDIIGAGFTMEVADFEIGADQGEEDIIVYLGSTGAAEFKKGSGAVAPLPGVPAPAPGDTEKKKPPEPPRPAEGTHPVPPIIVKAPTHEPSSAPASMPASAPASQPTNGNESEQTWFGKFVEHNPEGVAKVLQLFALSGTGQVDGVVSVPDGWHSLPTPFVNFGVPRLRLMIDNPYVPVAVYGGPLVGGSLSASVWEQENRWVLPGVLGGNLGIEGFYFPMVRRPFTKAQQDWWIADKIGFGGYLEAGFAQAMFRTDGVSKLTGKVWEQQHVFLKPGLAVRMDFDSWVGIIVRTGPVLGLKYQRLNGWWQKDWTLFPEFGWSFSVEPYIRIPYLAEQLPVWAKNF